MDAGQLSSRVLIKDDVYISRYSSLRAGFGGICINEKVNIGEGSFVDGNGGIEIGKNSLIARNVVLLTGNHVFKDLRVPIRFQGGDFKKVVIGEDVWLGAHVVVLPGVTIGDGSVIGAGVVVTNDIPGYSLAVGVPAKAVGKRE